MADLSVKERLQPSLLDRLIDNEPGKREESREQRVLSLSKLRKCVLRDLAWLLNTSSFESVQDLEPYPFVQHSVINFGIVDLVGKTVSGLKIASLEKQIRQAIWDFEPRIIKETVVVKISVDAQRMNPNALIFVIEGDLWAQPLPLHLYIKTELDLENGAMRILEEKS